MIDLHTHSTASDGTLTPSQIINLGESIGLTALALTDHDCIDGLGEAQKAAEGKKIKFIPGIELSSVYKEKSIHIAGLFINFKNSRLLETLNKIQSMRKIRNLKIIQRLNDTGISLTLEEVTQISKGDILGRPHFAMALVNRKVVSSVKQAFDHYLGPKGKAYVKKERLSTENCIQLILSAGGIPILAHPDQLKLDYSKLDKTVNELVTFGLKGIEVFCAPYTSSQIHEFSKIAKKYNLLRSGGSDFHGKMKPEIKLGRGFGSMYIPDKILDEMIKYQSRGRPACLSYE
jgi:predicted metal-dependent phosphoesterase TrpH